MRPSGPDAAGCEPLLPSAPGKVAEEADADGVDGSPGEEAEESDGVDGRPDEDEEEADGMEGVDDDEPGDDEELEDGIDGIELEDCCWLVDSQPASTRTATAIATAFLTEYRLLLFMMIAPRNTFAVTAAVVSNMRRNAAGYNRRRAFLHCMTGRRWDSLAHPMPANLKLQRQYPHKLLQ